MNFSQLPTIGQPLEGGIFAGISTREDGAHVAVVLLPDRSDRNMPWGEAMSWAEQCGGELPSRPVLTLLFSNLKDRLDEDWYWTNEEYDEFFAWRGWFPSGGHAGNQKDNEGRVRAVRLIEIT